MTQDHAQWLTGISGADPSDSTKGVSCSAINF
jgi:hypothetical protein